MLRPVIPVFNLLNALGVPFVDKTAARSHLKALFWPKNATKAMKRHTKAPQVTVSTLSRAIVAGLEDETVSGVQRFPEMEALEQKL